MNNFTAIDVPFNSRHTCWFCGDMSDMSLYFPRRQDDRKVQTHLPLELPICNECNGFAKACVSNSTSHLRLQIKHHLLKKYAKTLGIGVNWTKLELEEVALDGAAFKGFKKSAWSMYEIAKQRVDYKGWDICVEGIPLSNLDESSYFQFEEMRFLNVDAAIDFYSKSESLSKMLLSELVRIVGDKRFSYALRITRINFDVSRKEEKQILREVELQEREQKDISELESVKAKAMSVSVDLDPSIRPVTIQGATATPEAIQWAFSRGISDLIKLDKFEDAFFEDHEHLGGMVAFQLYNGLQLYLEAREDVNWIESNDLNRYLWEESDDEIICFDEFIDVLLDYEIRQTSDYHNLFAIGPQNKTLPKDPEQSYNTSWEYIFYCISKKQKPVEELSFGNSYVAAAVLHDGEFTDVCSFTFDKMTNQQIARKFIQLLGINGLIMKIEEAFCDETTDYILLKGIKGSLVEIIVTDCIDKH